MLGRVLGKKSYKSAASKGDDQEISPSAASVSSPAAPATSTGRLTRYNQRARNLTHSLDGEGNVTYTYPAGTTPESSRPGTSGSTTDNDSQLQGSSHISRTQSQTSAQRYKTNIQKKQQLLQPQEEEEQPPSAAAITTPSNPPVGPRLHSYRNKSASPDPTSSQPPQLPPISALPSEDDNDMQNGFADALSDNRDSHANGSADRQQANGQESSSTGVLGGIGALAAGGAAAGGAVLGKLLGRSDDQPDHDEREAPNGQAGRADSSGSAYSGGSGGPPARKPVPRLEDLSLEGDAPAVRQSGRQTSGFVPTTNGTGAPSAPKAAPSQPAAESAQTTTKRNIQLTPQQRHYLIKALVSLQMANEAREVEKLGTLTLYGHPFSPERPKLKRLKKDLVNEYTSGGGFEDGADDPYAEADDDVVRRAEGLQEPVILRHLFHAHLLPFPGLDTAPLKYWQARIQVFFDEMAARNFSTSMERGEISKRRFFALAGIRYLALFFSRGVGVRGEGELKGPGPGEPGSDKWGKGKQWGKGTVKRGLDKPIRIDSQLMAQIDDLFDGEEGKQWKLAGKEALRVRSDWHAFKEHVIEHEDGIEDVQRHLDINNIKNLPPRYRNAEEWARNHAAYILHVLFVSSPDADATFKVLKGIHTLFPYWGAKQLLKYANAQLMIQGILGLLLARPAGSKSLVQRVFSFVIGKEATAIEKDFIIPIKKAIQEPELASLVEAYVKRGSRPERRMIKVKTLKSGNDVLTTILLEGNHDKPSKQLQERIVEMQRCYGLSRYRSSLNDAYPEGVPITADRKQRAGSGLSGEQARKATQFALLKLLLRECLKKRDREQANAIASGSLIPTIIKDSLENVFYGIIKSIANVSDLSARLGDLQAFNEDLIQVKKKGDDSLQAWIALAARHENSLYYLFHECTSIAQPFFDWLQLGSDFMALSTSDPSNPDDRTKKNIEVNVEEMLSDPRLSDDDVNRVLREVDNLTQWTLWQKVSYELEHRKNFLLAYPDAAPSSGLGVDQVPSPKFKREIEDIDGLLSRLMRQNGVKLNDGICRSEARGTEAADYSWIYFDDVDPCSQHLMGEEEVADLKYEPKQVSYPPPTLLHARKVLPRFREILLSEMPNWRGRQAAGRTADGRRGSTASGAATSTFATPSSESKSADTRSVKSKKSFKIPFL